MKVGMQVVVNFVNVILVSDEDKVEIKVEVKVGMKVKKQVGMKVVMK